MSNAAGYATALLELAEEAGSMQAVYEQCMALETALKEERALLSFFTSPNLSVQERESGIHEVLSGAETILCNTVKLLCSKGEGGDLPQVLKSYREQYQKAKGILPAQAITAVPLTQQAQDKLVAALSAQTGKTILLTNTVDPTVLGGVRVVMDGKSIDGTVQAKLEDMRQKLNLDLSLDF